MAKVRLSDGWIILLFALLHAAVALGCRALGMSDEIALTLLTMLLVMLICLRQGTGEWFMALSIILVNVAGFAIGKGLSLLLNPLLAGDLVRYPLSTFLTTMILGWTVRALARQLSRKFGFREAGSGHIRWLLLAFVLIITVRVAILLMTPGGLDTRNVAASILVDYVFTLGVMIFLAEAAVRINLRAREDQERARLEQYRYMNLSQHVNPHFLFNSLNILDCLVCDGKQEQASAYIHKLAGVYRYLTSNEEERLVSLRREMEFVSQYVDLLKVRFPEGLEVEVDLPEDLLSAKVVPCSVQLLIENAIKHNAVEPADPLRIRVRASEGSLTVSNNRKPKLRQTPSTGLGQKYLRGQYKDVAGADVRICETDDEYVVEIPLI
ncbi:MAG: histidine kinase [Bacteroidales bacterium]|nr:histidine kinase [Bacteroidales bacterium]